ncbi:hypothetical protein J4E90_010582 [Alternaria incomplexa]|uniref:uncharacterized protein n=1 Tax=Alternaria incomplexa TaxID=1187928 RepID=UPI00221F83B7|nr:uncharacterized protein J4E90_010582 [Alternaria incomplexa]KAI4906363.1 hypothetical protein J4E90_010582 [Alternaria incomplexa]
MPPFPKPPTSDSASATWLLQSFATGKGAKITGPATLFLDRANAELGFIRYFTPNIASVAWAAWRDKSKKVSVLLWGVQLDLEFVSPDRARSFLDVLEDIATAAGNHFFYSYEVPQKVAFVKPDFDMEQQGFTSRVAQPWMTAPADASEWPHLRKTCEWSDFTVIAGGSEFRVHRVKLCKESHYFKAVCSGGFAETAKQSIELPESAQVISTLLDEMYGVYNSITGSIFTNFALRMEIEKEHIMNQLLDLSIAADKYNLENIKRRAAEAIIDRLPFITDPPMIVDLATCIYHEQCPEKDRGLRKAIIECVRMRMPAILDDESAWEEFSENKNVLRAFHMLQCEASKGGGMIAGAGGGGMMTPPATPR